MPSIDFAARRAALAAIGAALVAPGLARAQAWPDKPLRLVIPFPAGGSTDIVGRLVGERLARSLGQPVVIDNRAGAGGTTGSDLVAKAPADGHTILMGTSSTHAIASSLYAKMPYDAAHDFMPITLLGTATILLVVHPDLPVRSVRELIAHLKAQPNAVSYGSTGNGSVSHLTAEHFKAMAGVEMQHVPYKGDSPMTMDLVAGRVGVAFGTAVAFLPYVQSGKLRALAVTNAQPSPVAPGLPTVDASGLPGFQALQWFGLLAPANTPRDVVARVNAEVGQVLRQPDVRERLQGLGMEVSGDGPDAFAEFMRAETRKWAGIVRASGAKVE
jgi:tripartite-type tricarboxylate transporter receptor subunit TctC